MLCSRRYEKTSFWYHPRRHLVAGILLALLSACTTVVPEPAETVSAAVQARKATDWRDEVIYFALTDRFANGSARNDDGGPGEADDAEPMNPLGWHGGDFAGITQKIKQGYFEKLGFNGYLDHPCGLAGSGHSGCGRPQPGEDVRGLSRVLGGGLVQVDPHYGTLEEFKSSYKKRPTREASRSFRTL
jgi:hypothetical protein